MIRGETTDDANDADDADDADDAEENCFGQIVSAANHPQSNRISKARSS